MFATDRLITPAQLRQAMPRGPAADATVRHARAALHALLHGADDRIALLVAPAADAPAAAIRALAAELALQQQRHAGQLLLVMALATAPLCAPPATPAHIDRQLRALRGLMLSLNAGGIPVALQFDDIVTPGYLEDGACRVTVAAGMTESQVQRELASAMAMPVGFQVGAHRVAIGADAIRAAAHPHHFLSINDDGHLAIAASSGNPACHLILQSAGGQCMPTLDAAGDLLATHGLPARLQADGADGSDAGQRAFHATLCAAIAGGEHRIMATRVAAPAVPGALAPLAAALAQAVQQRRVALAAGRQLPSPFLLSA